MTIAHPNAPVDATWFTSSYSNGAGGECLACAITDSGVLIRDSKDAAGPVIAVSGRSWQSFANAQRRR
ncbi:DUF397 domain-containing protein [Streptomyces sp. bgisy153]|uniref:DUF397 domain-containing protein n=1 Tax=Streptomyces sp. bgisy153 TaxID=3413793 RepID=UPI003D7121C5